MQIEKSYEIYFETQMSGRTPAEYSSSAVIMSNRLHGPNIVGRCNLADTYLYEWYVLIGAMFGIRRPKKESGLW